jgi:hypothetical protein
MAAGGVKPAQADNAACSREQAALISRMKGHEDDGNVL